MITVTDEELKELELVGFGTFGRVFKKDDNVAYKIYNPLVREGFSEFYPNPCLKRNKNRYRLLKALNDKLIYTDLYQDLIYMDDKLSGVTLKYYDGTTLNNLLDEKFTVKMDISRQLVRNSKELSSNHIYPLDCKLNNVIYTDGDVKIIDLDDTLTKVSIFPNYFYKMIAIYSIIDTIKSYFREYSYSYFDDHLYKYLNKDFSKVRPNYKAIDRFLDNKEIKRNYLIVDKESDLEQIKSFLELDDLKILYNYYNDDIEVLLETAKRFYEEKIPIYDFVNNIYISNYFNDHSVNDIYEIKNKQLIKK